MTLTDLLSLSLLMLCTFACVMELPNAIEREMRFNESIRASRCERNYVAGYCDAQEIARAQ